MTDNADPARMERLLLRARELVPLQEVYVIPIAAGAHYRLWVVFGEFSTEDEAAAAARRLPPRYQQAFRVSPASSASSEALCKSQKVPARQAFTRNFQTLVLLCAPGGSTRQ